MPGSAARLRRARTRRPRRALRQRAILAVVCVAAAAVLVLIAARAPQRRPSPALALGPVSKLGGCQPRGSLPDPDCTPGAVDPRVAGANIDSTICSRGYTRRVRPPVSETRPIKAERMAAYGYAGLAAAAFELDHLVPLELGGAADARANLWPEPRHVAGGAERKDLVENAAHAAVCSGRLALVDAQRAIATDWVALGTRLHAG